MRITAAAPSDICELLPAVTLPLAANTVFSLASASGVESGRGPSSVSAMRVLVATVPAARSGTEVSIEYGAISSLKPPAAIALAAFWWLATAKASWSSRETFHCFATFSAVMPMP